MIFNEDYRTSFNDRRNNRCTMKTQEFRAACSGIQINFVVT